MKLIMLVILFSGFVISLAGNELLQYPGQQQRLQIFLRRQVRAWPQERLNHQIERYRGPRDSQAQSKATTALPLDRHQSAEKKVEALPKKGNQKISCRPGRAMYDLNWKVIYKDYKKFSIFCDNFTNSCEEKCEYNIECSRRLYGDKLYVRGIYAVYDRFMDKQVYFLFLCCNATNIPLRTCTGRKQLKDAGHMEKKFSQSFREASSTYMTGPNTDVKNGGKISMELCIEYKHKNSSLCAYAYMPFQNAISNSVSQSTIMQVNGIIAGTVTTGAVADGVGLALQIQTTTPHVYTCPVVVDADCDESAANFYYQTTTSVIGDCANLCLSDSNCGAMDWYGYTCSLFASCVTRSQPPGSGYCIKV